VRTFIAGILLCLSVVPVFASPARDTPEVCPAYFVLLKPTPANATPEEKLRIGEQRFVAATSIRQNGTGAQLSDGGRALAIAPEHMESVTEAFTNDCTTAPPRRATKS
jgi:hypothetical protein